MFYDSFIELCKKNNVKPTPLVVSMGLSSSNVSMWKKGSTPRPSVIKKIADYFGVTVDYFMEGEQKENPPTPKGGGLHETMYDSLTQEEQDAVNLMIESLYKRRFGG